MKNLCVSLETAKALKAAGWTEDTCLAYGKNGYMLEPPFGWSADMDLAFPAPTAEEVLRELPEKIDLKEWRRDLQFLFIAPEKGKWEVSYGEFKKFRDKSLSEAAAQMWLWCVSEGHIKSEGK
jgi:hypothetical protein